MVDAGHHAGGVEEIERVPPQVSATPGMPERKAVERRRARVREILHTLPTKAQRAILDDFEAADGNGDDRSRHDGDKDTAAIPTSHRR